MVGCGAPTFTRHCFPECLSRHVGLRIWWAPSPRYHRVLFVLFLLIKEWLGRGLLGATARYGQCLVCCLRQASRVDLSGHAYLFSVIPARGWDGAGLASIIGIFDGLQGSYAERKHCSYAWYSCRNHALFELAHVVAQASWPSAAFSQDVRQAVDGCKDETRAAYEHKALKCGQIILPVLGPSILFEYTYVRGVRSIITRSSIQDLCFTHVLNVLFAIIGSVCSFHVNSTHSVLKNALAFTHPR